MGYNSIYCVTVKANFTDYVQILNMAPARKLKSYKLSDACYAMKLCDFKIQVLRFP